MTDHHCARCRRRYRYWHATDRPPCPACGEPMKRGAGRGTRPDRTWNAPSMSPAETLRRALDTRR